MHFLTNCDIYCDMDTSFLELRCKEGVNVVDGRRLGHIVDVVFSLESGYLQGLVVPGEKTSWNLFKSAPELFIPVCQIVKVGEDAVLVELFTNNGQQPQTMAYIAGGKKKK